MKSLIIVDVQNDFCPGGPLAVAQGDLVVPVINRLQRRFDLVVATQDWHPANHGSFAESHPGREPGEVIELAGLDQILWPTHCVEDTPGAEFHPALDCERVAAVFTKGTDPSVDSYSGFFDNDHRRATGLGDFLSSRDVRDVYVCGLATDYCVKCTALDAVRLGFNVHLVSDACRGVDLSPGDVDRAVAEMQAAGVSVIQSTDLARPSGK